MEVRHGAQRPRGRLRAFWVLPAACTVTAVALGLLLPQLDAAVVRDRLPLLFPGGPAGARELLSSIISSMISFTGLVFSITIVVLQLTSSQFSPRVLRTFLDDRGNQLALGIFVATFVYALTVMRVVRAADEGAAFVPRISVTFAFALVLASVTVFIYYIHHISHSIRVASIGPGPASSPRSTRWRWSAEPRTPTCRCA